MKNILILFVLLISSNLIFAQDNPKKCMTTKLVKEELKNNPEYELMRQNLINYHQEHKNVNNTKQAVIEIPVVIHVVHRTQDVIGANTNISILQIEDQLRILNEDYSKTNPEFPNPPRNTFVSLAGNPELQFCLATIDPNGNPTSGITRTATAQLNWDADDDSNTTCHQSNGMKKTSCGGKDGWNPSKYLNIWVCDLTNSLGGGMTLGYAYLPGLLADFNSSNDYKDGLVVDYRYFGTVGVAAPSSDGRTPTHEIGHYFGLMHTFCEDTDSQGNPICCDNDDTNWGGYVDDTPASEGIYFGAVTASTTNNTCNDLSYSNVFNTDVFDMDENYMSYAANTWMFSQGQVDVMLSTLNKQDWQGGRLNLKNSNVSTNCSGIISSINNLAPNINLNIYPNPTKGELFINTSEKIISISACNIIGKDVVLNTYINNNQLDISQLSNGIYFISIYTEKGVITKKIIVSK